MVAFARQTASDAFCTTAEQVAALKQHGYTDAEIFDIAAVAAGRAFFAKLLDALGTLPDSALLGLDESFRRALTVGRPIESPDAEPNTLTGSACPPAAAATAAPSTRAPSPSVQVDRQLEAGGLLDRHLGGVGPLEDAIHLRGRARVGLAEILPVAQQRFIAGIG